MNKQFDLDTLLERPENHRVEADGTELYGCMESPNYSVFSKEYWRHIKERLQQIGAAFNPRNSHRAISRDVVLKYNNPSLYKLLFPLRWMTDVVRRLCSRINSLRRQAFIEDVLDSTLFQDIIMPLLLGAILVGGYKILTLIAV